MRLSDIKDLLMTVTLDTFHYYATMKPDQYIVWAEDGQADDLHSDDAKTEQVIQGTIDYFTKEEFDPNFDLIQKKLNSTEISWRLNSVQYEEDTSYIHYEWVFELDMEV